MAYNFKEYMERPERLTSGHRMCAGCGASIALRNVLKAVKPEDHAVISNATSCMEVLVLCQDLAQIKMRNFSSS